MDYTKGVDLLVEITHKQQFYNLFTGKDIALADKLAYEICKVAYIKSRIRTFKDDPKVLVLAAAQAQKAVDYILMHQLDGRPDNPECLF